MAGTFYHAAKTKFWGFPNGGFAVRKIGNPRGDVKGLHNCSAGERERRAEDGEPKDVWDLWDTWDLWERAQGALFVLFNSNGLNGSAAIRDGGEPHSALLY
jgi:hypothetical protein